MLSFMVVSAVGFAVYMRQSRVPSSYLRRSASSRYLLKAALANAVNRIDGCYAKVNGMGRCEGIYDDPYPGVGWKQSGNNNNNNTSAVANDGDYWVKRVFTPFGHVSRDTTVSTLTLEALAYLPPAIINEARVYSRETRTAQWKNLAYDMGRYAFCAIDVSDCFDINKLNADARRTSAPGQRITLSSLYPTKGAELFNILKQCSQKQGFGKADNKSNVPFVSLADFNLVAGTGSSFAPFCKFLTSGKDVSIYNQSAEDYVANALFVTDTWFPPTNTTASVRKIDLARQQPFRKFTARNADEVDACRDSKGKVCDLLAEKLGETGFICLYDYLDEDSVPVSLTLPTVETAPMICGLAFDAQDSLKMEALKTVREKINYTVPATASAKEKRRVRTITDYAFKGFSGANLHAFAMAMFPFKHANGTNGRNGKWKIEILAGVFFAQESLGCRPTKHALHPTDDDWKKSAGAPYVRGGVIWGKVSKSLPKFTDDIKRTQDAFVTFDEDLSLSKKLNIPIFHVIDETEQEVDEEGNVSPTTTTTRDGAITFDGTDDGDDVFTVFTADGEIEKTWNDRYAAHKGKKIFDKPEDLAAGKDQVFEEGALASATQYKPYVALWARIVADDGEDSGKTVDLVPASADDDAMAAMNLGGNITELDYIRDLGGAGTPLLDFRAKDHAFAFTRDGLDAVGDGQSIAFECNSLYTPDPRYNFAPENWYGYDDGGDAKYETWKQNFEGLFGVDQRDPDIFMATSDQEYLQSIAELEFLPRVNRLRGKSAQSEDDVVMQAKYQLGKNTSFLGKTLAGCAHGDFFWKTYGLERHNDNLYSLKYEKEGVEYAIVSGSGDFRVNPFSTDRRVMLAALSSTPYCWAVASTNKTLNPTYDMKPSQQAQWAFGNSQSEGAVANGLAHEDIEDIADRFCDVFRSEAQKANGYVEWANIYDDLAWYDGQKGDEQKSFLGVDDLQEPLHSVDRKYLYGFWRECFQNRQQLFLVFLRAEPLTVGGSGNNALGNSQLGARGVALVWRDPAPPTGDTGRPPRTNLSSVGNWEQYYKQHAPHRTRVLFYHQFD